MTSQVSVIELTTSQWERYRDIRVQALTHDGDAFGGNLADESKYSQSQWQEKAVQYVGLVAEVDGVDVGFMTVENLEGDFGATAWIGSCWVSPNIRGKGVLTSLFAHLDSKAEERDWGTQGLGVWITNTGAIAAYEKIGFVSMGEPSESTRKPGTFYQRMIRKSSY
jgi:GNAT superfamily N-acetyltransferase